MIRLSICLAVKNGERFLPRTLDSLFLEMKEGYEVIAVDDGSSDKSGKILADYGVEVIPAPASLGLAMARNLSIERAQGEFITFFDQDDIVMPGSFARRLDFLLAHPETNAVAGEIADVIDNEDNAIGDFYELSGKARLGNGELSWQLLKEGRVIPGALWLYLFRKDFLKNFGLFNPACGVLTDQDFLYRVLQKNPIAHAAIPVARYRIHGANSTVSFQKGRIQVNERTKALGVLLQMKYGLIP